MVALLVLESPQLWPAAAAAGVALSVCIVWLYLRQVDSAGPAGWSAVVLRWAAVAALAISVLKPVLLTPKTAEQWGAVVVLIDRSRSMGVVDSGRSPAELVALAAGLARLPAGTRPDSAERLAADLERLQSILQDVLTAQSDLEYARVSGRGIQERQERFRQAAVRYANGLAQVLAREPQFDRAPQLKQALGELRATAEPNARDPWGGAARMIERALEAARKDQAASDEQLYHTNEDVHKACDALGKVTRLGLCEDAVLRPQSGLVSHLAGTMPVVGFSFNQALAPLELTEAGKPIRRPGLTANGVSDLSGAVVSVMTRLSGRPIRAVVLLSDGRQVGGRGELASGVRPSGVPIFTIGVAPSHVPDAAVWSVSMPSTAFAGETVEAEAEVRYSGGIKSPTEVHAKSGSQEIVERLTPRGEERARESAARFTLKAVPDDPALPAQSVLFTLPPQEGEVTQENNRASRWMKVSSDKVRVAVCTAAPSWDFQYFRGTLSRAQWVRLESQVLDPQTPKLGLSPEQILDQDVLVFSDMPAKSLDFNRWAAVDRLVRERGGSVILIAGTTYPVSEYLEQPTAASLLLPFADAKPLWKEWPGEQPAFHFVPTPFGERAALRLLDGRAASERLWQDLPGVFRYLQIPERSLRPGVQKLLLESDSGAPVLTEQRQGAGRVLFLGLNETWRWRLKAGEREADRFWRQIVRYAAGEAYAAVQGPVALDVDRVAIEPGMPVHVRARVRGAQFPPDSARSCELEILRDQKVISRRALDRIGTGRFAGEIRDLPEGDCHIQFRAKAADGADVAVTVPVHVAPTFEAEMRDVSGDPARLAKLARASGGQYLPIEHVDRLADRLNSLRETESQYLRRPLWNSPYLYAFVLACLACEWALRKRLGLA